MSFLGIRVRPISHSQELERISAVAKRFQHLTGWEKLAVAQAVAAFHNEAIICELHGVKYVLDKLERFHEVRIAVHYLLDMIECLKVNAQPFRFTVGANSAILKITRS